MRLRKPCEHGRYDEHRALRPGGSPRRSPETSSQYFDCPGGEFLADDALVVERLDDRELYRGVKRFIKDWHAGTLPVRPFHDVASDAIFNETTVREGA